MKSEECQPSPRQQIVFDKIIKICKGEIIAEKTGNMKSKPLFLKAHGGACVGKTFLINRLKSWIHKIY